MIVFWKLSILKKPYLETSILRITFFAGRQWSRLLGRLKRTSDWENTRWISIIMIFLIIYTCLILNSDRMPASLVWHTCKFLFFHSSLKPQAIIQMLEPFLKFVLQDPKVTVNQLVRQQLFTSLLQTASSLLKCPGMPLLFTL